MVRHLSFAGADEGQALIMVAGGFAMLLLAVALSLDVGYAFVQRRALENAAQASALAAGRLLATSVVMVKDGLGNSYPAFPAYDQESVYSEVCKFIRVNAVGPTSATYGLTVELFDNAGASRGSVSETYAATNTTCAVPATSTPITTDPTLTYLDVRVSARITYSAVMSGIGGSSSSTSGGSARARVGGAPVSPPPGNAWPMVRQYVQSELNGGYCGSPCTPTAASPVPFWSSGGSFKGLVDFARYSPAEEKNQSTLVPQLISSWDQTGSYYATPTPRPFKSDMTGNCSQSSVPGWTNGHWDTSGQGDDTNNRAQCSIPNWAYQGFGGSLSVSKNWVTDVSGSQEAPNPVPTARSQCTSLPSYLTAPSCTNGSLGDWIEVSTSSGSLGSNMATPLCSFILAAPTANDFETVSTPGGGGTACAGMTYTDPADGTTKTVQSGKYGVSRTVWLYLWDCVETYKKTGALGNRWDKGWTGSDCPTDPNKLDRVHLFAVAPFTFYVGLVQNAQISGFWGGGFGNPDSCPSGTCSLNALSNTTFLVGD